MSRRFFASLGALTLGATLGAAAFAQQAPLTPTPKAVESAKPAAQSCPATDRKVKPMVRLTTSLGVITLELDAEKAPKTVENFLKYVNAGHYNGTIFHRVINDFMIQGGGFSADMKQKPAESKVENEAKNGLKNVAYSIAMARTSDPHSASAQFFINVKDNAFLDYPGRDGWGYAVFGKVVEGQDVVDKIKKIATGVKAGMSDVPTETVTITKAEVC